MAGQPKVIREFDMKVWDGTSPSRSDPLVRKGPDGTDWKKITSELQKVQTFVVNLAANAEEMPNVVEEVKSRVKQLDLIGSQLAKLKVPEDLTKRMNALEEKVEEMCGIYVHAGEVLQTVKLLQRQLLSMDARIREGVTDAETKRIAFENRVSNWQRVTERRVNERLKKLEEDAGTVGV